MQIGEEYFYPFGPKERTACGNMLFIRPSVCKTSIASGLYIHGSVGGFNDSRGGAVNMLDFQAMWLILRPAKHSNAAVKSGNCPPFTDLILLAMFLTNSTEAEQSYSSK